MPKAAGAARPKTLALMPASRLDDCAAVLHRLEFSAVVKSRFEVSVMAGENYDFVVP